jgi:hypothetical protein
MMDLKDTGGWVNANAPARGWQAEKSKRHGAFFSDDGNFLTGLCYAVDGGWSASGRTF